MAKQRLPEGPPPPPVVQKVRIRYAKRGRLRFTSSRDFQRALERALRRAKVPVAFSAGFHPHPKISYANAAATGTASEAEYVEVSLHEHRDAAGLADLLNQSLPDGLDVVTVVDAAEGALADRLQASQWRMTFAPQDAAAARAGFAALEAADHVEVSRMMKTGLRTFDVRAAIRTIEVDDTPEATIVTAVLAHVTPTVRPQDVLSAVADLTGEKPSRPPLVTRLAQGPLRTDGTVGDPLQDPAEDGSGA